MSDAPKAKSTNLGTGRVSGHAIRIFGVMSPHGPSPAFSLRVSSS
jgi:hypothetical protein